MEKARSFVRPNGAPHQARVKPWGHGYYIIGKPDIPSNFSPFPHKSPKPQNYQPDRRLIQSQPTVRLSYGLYEFPLCCVSKTAKGEKAEFIRKKMPVRQSYYCPICMIIL
jgi:hypothetical protein